MSKQYAIDKEAMLRGFLTFRWIFTTLLVLAVVGAMVRLGFWQLDRHEQRAEFNARLQAQIDAPALDLNRPFDLEALPEMEYRQVVARGVYDPSGEIMLRNQVYNSQPGYHVLTPLRLEGSSYSVLVDRGFIPLEDGSPEIRAKYAQPGPVEVRGVLRRPVTQRTFGAQDPTLAPGQERLDAWNMVNLPRIQEQVASPLLPMYVALLPGDEPPPGLPAPNASVPAVDPGSHLGYAMQWFSFAAVLAIGYPFFLRKSLIERPV